VLKIVTPEVIIGEWGFSRLRGEAHASAWSLYSVVERFMICSIEHVGKRVVRKKRWVKPRKGQQGMKENR